MSNFMESALLLQAQITLMQIDLLRAAAQPLTPEEARFASIEHQIRQLENTLNRLALPIDRFKAQFDEWEKAKAPQIDWSQYQQARNR
jgi:hypothetical protein